ncbi:DoxX family protein [Carboxylicivirga sp. RSCT41]|uniref:DoxX family protein n=1 Tax=Carboxylicivirga agarovorans TaxID=3417570 RepID=UPI003D329665
MSKRDKIIYWIATGLLSAMMLMSAGMYIFNNAAINEAFIKLGYPTYIIYPLAIAKLFGLLAILTNKSKVLKEWAYAGFFFDFVLAAAAHISVNDGEEGGAYVALALLIVSYIFGRKR